MRVYVSGPMTGIAEFNFPEFNRVAELLARAGYEVENPAAKGVVDGWRWHDYLRYDLRKLLDCDAVAMLDGWERSPGACFERDVALKLEMTVLPYKDMLIPHDTH